jgi:large subunit ribosomal protein L10
MNKAEKTATIEVLKEKFSNVDFFYLTDASTMTVGQINNFRRLCYEKGIEVKVVKNSLLRKALETFPESRNYTAVFEALKGSTAVLFAQGAASGPAKTLKEFRDGGGDRPQLKGAYIDTAVYFGDDQLDALTKLKSKEDLLGEVIGLLQSPMSNLLGALQSGGGNIMGLLKALEERGDSNN